MALARDALIGTACILLAGCAPEQPRVGVAVSERDGDFVRVRFEGYYTMSCSGSDLQRYVEDGADGWSPIIERPHRLAYLDGEWLGPDLSMCCIVGCYPAEERVVDTRLYVSQGERRVPDDVAEQRAEQLGKVAQFRREARAHWETSDPAYRKPWEEVENGVISTFTAAYASGIDVEDPFVAPAYREADPEGRMRAAFYVFADSECTVRDTAEVVFMP